MLLLPCIKKQPGSIGFWWSSGDLTQININKKSASARMSCKSNGRLTPNENTMR